MKQILRKVNPVLFTKVGFEKIQKEKEQLLIDRVDAVGHLKKSREMGDLSENGYYKASRQKLNFIDGRIRRVNFLLRYGVVTAPVHTNTVQVGVRVKLHDGEQEVSYQIVGEEEANPREGKISHVSPLGRMLMGRKEGESVEVASPSGKRVYTIITLAAFA